MGIGGSIFLLVFGAILAFAVKDSPEWIDLHIVGWILMIAGTVGIVLTLSFWKSKKTAENASADQIRRNNAARQQARRAEAQQQVRPQQRPGGSGAAEPRATPEQRKPQEG